MVRGGVLGGWRTERQTPGMRNFRRLKSGGWRVLLAVVLAVPAATALATAIECAVGLSPAAAQSGVIRDIQVSGNRRVEPETVRSYLKFTVGDAYDAGKVDQSIRALFSTGLFQDVRIDRSPNGVTIVVVENPVVNQVAFEGNSEVEKTALEAEVQLKPRAVFTRVPMLPRSTGKSVKTTRKSYRSGWLA